MQDQDRVGSAGVQFAVGFVSDIDGRKIHAAVEGQGIETNDLGFDDHSVCLSIVTAAPTLLPASAEGLATRPIHVFACSFASCPALRFGSFADSRKSFGAVARCTGPAPSAGAYRRAALEACVGAEALARSR